MNKYSLFGIIYNKLNFDEVNWDEVIRQVEAGQERLAIFRRLTGFTGNLREDYLYQMLADKEYNDQVRPHPFDDVWIDWCKFKYEIYDRVT